MELNVAVTALGALAHETRLQIFRLLVQAGASGLSVGTRSATVRLSMPQQGALGT